MTIILDAGGGVVVNEMKAKLPICLLFVILCALFVGCSSPANDMNTSRRGVLSTGQEFVFYGADQMDATIEEFLEEMGFEYRRTYSFVIQEDTIEAILERPEMQELVHVPPEYAVIYAYYFAETRDILFWVELRAGASLMGFPSVRVVNHESGVVSRWGWRTT